MGDYVLEGNPALERLFERLRAPDEPPPLEESSSSECGAKRSLRGRRSKVHAADHPEVLRGDLTAGVQDPAERATVADPEAITEEVPVVVDDLWVIHEDPPSSDEMILIDFDEEPEVFDEDLGEFDDDAAEDEDDEILDVYEGEESDDEGEAADEDEVFDEEDAVLAKDDEGVVDDEVPVRVAGAFKGDGGDWILGAFEVWMHEALKDEGERDHEDLEVFDEDEVDEDDFDEDELFDVFDEDEDEDEDVDTEDRIQVPQPSYEHDEDRVALLEPTVEQEEPYHSALLALSAQLSANAGRTKARHKKQSPREKKRSSRQAEQDARKATEPSMKALLPGLSQPGRRTESSPVPSAQGVVHQVWLNGIDAHVPHGPEPLD
jgi:hypothetical protein